MSFESKIIKIPVDMIIIPSNRFTSVYNNVDWLCRNMMQSGFILPIVVKKERQGKYVLIDGFNRIQCLQRYGIKEVPAIVVKDADSIEYYNMLVNYVRGKRCGWYILQSINQLLIDNVDTDKIATLLGKSKGTIKNYVSTYKNLLTKLSKDQIDTIINYCVPVRILITCSKEDNPMDCVLKRVKPYQADSMRIEEIVRKISLMIKHVLRTNPNVDIDLLIRKINEALNEVIELSKAGVGDSNET